MDREKRLFIALLIIWGGLLLYRFLFFEGTRTAPMKYTKGAVSTANKGEGETSMKLRTQLLKTEPPVPLSETKNIFAPLPSPKPPPPPVKKAVPPPPPPPEPPPVVLPPPPEVRGPTPEELALAQARSELAEFRYLGFLDRGNGKREGFFSKRQEAIIAGKGETVFGHFMVKELSENLAVIEEAATHAEVTLQLSEGKTNR